MIFDRDKCHVYTPNKGRTLVLAPTSLGALCILQQEYGLHEFKLYQVRRFRGPFRVCRPDGSGRARTVDEKYFISTVATYGDGIVHEGDS